MRKFIICIAFLSGLFCSCEKIDDFIIRKNDKSSIFNDIKFSSMPDGLWLRGQLHNYKLSDSGHIKEEALLTGNPGFSGEVEIYYLWEGNEVVAEYMRYIFKSESIDDVVITSHPEYDEYFSLNKKTRKGHCPPYTYVDVDEVIIVTELTSDVFSFITDEGDGWWNWREFTKKDGETLEMLQNCPRNTMEDLEKAKNESLKK